MSLIADTSIFDDYQAIDTLLVAGTPDFALAYSSGDFHTWLRRRAPKGLLGGMTEIPGTGWTHNFDLAEARRAAKEIAPFVADRAWRRLPGSVHHVFTHFPLELTVFVAEVPKSTRAPAGMRFVQRSKLDGEALPTLMRKVVAHA